MENAISILTLYSISKAAQLMEIGRDTLKSLIAQGRIGFITIGENIKISHSELVRFQQEETERNRSVAKNEQSQYNKVNNFFSNQKQNENQIQLGVDILESIMRKENGNSQNKI